MMGKYGPIGDMREMGFNDSDEFRLSVVSYFMGVPIYRG
jgi:hypothetical protein